MNVDLKKFISDHKLDSEHRWIASAFNAAGFRVTRIERFDECELWRMAFRLRGRSDMDRVPGIFEKLGIAFETTDGVISANGEVGSVIFEHDAGEEGLGLGFRRRRGKFYEYEYLVRSVPMYPGNARQRYALFVSHDNSVSFHKTFGRAAQHYYWSVQGIGEWPGFRILRWSRGWWNETA